MKKPTKNQKSQTTQQSEAKPPRPVLVTTEHKGVFFGYADATDGEQISLKQARLCVKWVNTRGFMGLAANGPNAQCRIGPAADITLRNITSVCEVTPVATKAFEAAPWG